MCSKYDMWHQFLLTIQETGLQPHYTGLCIVQTIYFYSEGTYLVCISADTSYHNWCFFIVFLSLSRKKFKGTTPLSHSCLLLILSSSSAVVLDWNTFRINCHLMQKGYFRQYYDYTLCTLSLSSSSSSSSPRGSSSSSWTVQPPVRDKTCKTKTNLT